MICKFHDRGTYFFDYGNSFLKAVFDAGVKEVCKNGENDLEGFVFPSYVEDILGPQLFDYGYGPFRWCCLSGKPEDLDKTDAAAMSCIDPNRRYQDRDNYVWVRDAKKNKLVVGTQCRILYQDCLLYTSRREASSAARMRTARGRRGSSIPSRRRKSRPSWGRRTVRRFADATA